jgi:hypothetical protein
MKKKYIVRLSNDEREQLQNVIKKLAGTSQKVRRVQILLKADADGPCWTDSRIDEAPSAAAAKRLRTCDRASSPRAFTPR